MSRAWIKPLKWIPLALTAVVAMLLLLAFCTELGVTVAWSLVRDRLPPTIQVESVDGRFIGPLTVTGVTVESEGMRLQVDHARLDWRASRLLMAQVQIADLVVEGVDIELRPSEQPAPLTDEPPRLDFRAPITLVIEQAQLRDFQLQTAPDADPLRVDSLKLAGVWNRNSLQVSELDVRSPLSGHLRATTLVLLERNGVRVESLKFAEADGALSTDLSGHIRRTAGRYSLKLAGNWAGLRWPLQGEPMLRSPQGEIDVGGTWPEVGGDLNAQLHSRGNVATVEARGGLTDGQVDTVLRWDDLAWPLEASAGPVQIRAEAGQLVARGPVDAVRLRGGTRLLPTDFKPVRVDLQAVANAQRIELDPLRVGVAGSETSLTGGLRWQPGLAASLQLRTRALDPSAMSPALSQWPGQIAGNATVEIETANDQLRVRIPQLHAEGSLREQALQVDAQATVSAEQLDVRQLRVQALGGSITGQADLAMRDQLKGTATLTARSLDPSLLLERWPGSVNADVSVQLAGTRDAPVVRVPTLKVDGRLRDRPIQLDGALRYAQDTANIERLKLVSGNSALAISGQVSAQRLAVDWDVSSPDLADFYPGLTGRVKGDGRAEGPLKTPQLTASLRGESLGYQRYSIAGIDAEADIDLADGSKLLLDVRIADAQVAATGVRTLVLETRGSADDLNLSLTTQTTEGELQLGLAGQLDVQSLDWTGEVTQLVVDPVDFPPWRLESPATVAFHQPDWSLGEACFVAEPGPSRRGGLGTRRSRLCLSGESDDQGLQAQTDIDYFDLAYLTPLLPPATRLTGSLQGEAAYSRRAEREALSADLRTSAVELAGTRSPDDPLDVAFSPGAFTVNNEGQVTTVTARLPLEDDAGAGLALDATLRGQGPLVDRPLDGRITAELTNLDFVALIIDVLTDVTGQFTADMQLAGRLGAPEIGGDMKLSGAAASIDVAGIDLREINATLSGNPAESLTVEASAKSGEGEITARARARMGETRQIDAKVQGERFLAFNTDDARVTVSPDLSFALVDRQANLQGRVVIPSADITPQRRDSESLIRASEDEVIIGPRAQEEDNQPIQLTATVDVVLGEQVRFEGFGLKSRIEGQITARDRPGNQTTATGELRLVDGAYKAYGQNLDIRRGRLIFAGGPIIEPGLDVKASRYPAEDIEVGVRVRGPLSQPEFELYSDPTMQQQEQLSYLVLGRSMDRKSGASGTEQAALANAALALGLKGGGFLANTLQDKVGLDEISIGAQAGESNDQAALVLGKYLSPKLYVSYGVALFKPGQSFRLRYLLSDKWTLKTETGTQTGGDLIYTIERD